MFGINWWFVENWREWILVSTKHTTTSAAEDWSHLCTGSKQSRFISMSWFEFSVWTLLFGYNDICFIFWQRILNRFWYLLTLSNMTDWRLYLIDYLRLMSQGFHVVAWTDCCPDAEELLNSAMPTYFVDVDDAGWRTRRSHRCVILYYLSTEHQTLCCS